MAEDAFRGRGEGRLAGRPGPIEVRLPDIPLWVPAEALAQLQQALADRLGVALQYAAGAIAEAVGDVGSSDTGALAQSFTAWPATRTGGIELAGTTIREDLVGRVFSSLPYAVVVNDGRRPGPISRAGIDAIGLWAQRKLGLTPAAAERAKWAIAQEIALRGTAGSDFFHKGVTAATPGVQHLLGTLADVITEKLTEVS